MTAVQAYTTGCRNSPGCRGRERTVLRSCREHRGARGRGRRACSPGPPRPAPEPCRAFSERWSPAPAEQTLRTARGPAQAGRGAAQVGSAPASLLAPSWGPAAPPHGDQAPLATSVAAASLCMRVPDTRVVPHGVTDRDPGQ